MSARKRKARSHVSNRERTVTTFTEDPNTSFLVPLASEDPPFFPMPFPAFVQPQQQPFFHHVLPPGKSDLEILENLKNIIRDGQHEFYRAVPQPAALAALYIGPLPTDQPIHDDVPSTVDTSPAKIGADPEPMSPQPDTDQPPPASDPPGEYGTPQPPDAAQPDKLPTKDEDQPPEAWQPDDTKDDPAARPDTAPDDPLPEDRRFHDRDRDRDRFDRDRDWNRDHDRHDSTRDFRDRDRDRRPQYFGRSYGRSHAPRPPPELRHYEPSYGPDYVPPPRRFDSDDRRSAPRNPSFDDRFKPPPVDDRRPPFDDRRPLPPSPEERPRPTGDPIPLARSTEDDRGAPPADDRPRANVPLEERLSQPAPPPSLQDRLSQPVPARLDIAPAPTLEERLSVGPVPPRAYPRAPSVARDDIRPPNRDFSRERPSGPSTYRAEPDRTFAARDDRDRRDRDIPDVDARPARFGDGFSRAGPPPQPRQFSPPPHVFDRDRDRERGRNFVQTRTPPPSQWYDNDAERRFTNDRERDTYERRRDWYGPADDDKRAPPPPPPASWRPHDRPFMDRDRDRFNDRERDRDRDARDRDRERERDLGGWQQWDERGRSGFPPSSPLPHSRMDTAGGVGPSRSLSSRLTESYGGDERGYQPPRDFERGRYGHLDDHHPHSHPHPPPPPFSRVRNRSLSPPRRVADDLRPPMKRMRDDNGPGYSGGAGYSPPRRAGGEYAPGPPPSSAATTTTVSSVVTSAGGTVAPRSAGTRTPPVSAPPTTAGTGAFYERDRERERERERDREREFVGRGEYGMGYDRDRGRRSPPPILNRMSLNGPGGGGGGGGYARGVVGDRRDDRRYVQPPPPPSRTS